MWSCPNYSQGCTPENVACCIALLVVKSVYVEFVIVSEAEDFRWFKINCFFKFLTRWSSVFWTGGEVCIQYRTTRHDPLPPHGKSFVFVGAHDQARDRPLYYVLYVCSSVSNLLNFHPTVPSPQGCRDHTHQKELKPPTLKTFFMGAYLKDTWVKKYLKESLRKHSFRITAVSFYYNLPWLKTWDL